ncbi:peptide ABC transporter substrate-binding protein [Prauserella sp. PE36]|uniref:Peptide ABC transporter substrate-binding protein n=1 Tax=Prauserella endophytica TaxID=1592324 RepID=A0ABY2S8S5_9PSEU|nr:MULTISPECIES: M55 family metallopeptidase [Prauserella]PXY29359.1 peptide ABC transporter substrate-binding protein [Prauserella coralliicola]RBM20913.1 peptide ABC transporter substrate-binding protein [Prauserella sp. PE36]TKG72308.1 peptide ABC transporter substrate-binding protein [Prauserella endophytica]
MRIMVSADMEGATGVTWTDDVVPGTEQWQRFRRLFTGDVNATIAGLCDAGADDVLVNEAHSSQRNLLLEDLDPRARMLTGRHKPLSMMEGIDSGVDGVVFLGYHAGAGCDGVLSHTYLPNQITGVWLDGVPASEGRLNAALAAEYGVPVLVVSGDDKTVEDARDYASDAALVAVKQCVSRYAAICSPPSVTAALLTEAAATGMKRAGRVEPVTGPHRIEVEFDASHLAQAAAVVPTVEQTGVRRVGFDAPGMTEAMKAFKVVTAIADGAVQGKYG